MKTTEQIRKVRDIMKERYESGKNRDLAAVIMPADAYNIAEALDWVLGEGTTIDEIFEHSGMKKV